MRVIARVRPFNHLETPHIDSHLSRIVNCTQRVLRITQATKCRDNSVAFTAPGRGIKRDVSTRSFKFDAALENASQDEVYKASVQPLLDRLLDGDNVTAFAYGATGCGKTFTMFGTLDLPGVVVCAMSDLFLLKELKEDLGLRLQMTYLEIYNEEIRDLLPLNDTQELQLNVRETKGVVSVTNSAEHTLNSMDDFMALLLEGNKRRAVHSTLKNQCSSRSHSILKISIRGATEARGTLTFVDLAGSERSTDQAKARAAEGAYINKSLLALGKCINALAHKQQHVPYRDSILTRLLKDCLKGKGLAVMIACLSPSSEDTYETRNTLEYAYQLRSLERKPCRTPPPTLAQRQAVTIDLYRKLLDTKQIEVEDRKHLQEWLPHIAQKHKVRLTEDLVKSFISIVPEPSKKKVKFS